MNRQCLACVLFLILFLSGKVFAQDEDLHSAVDYKVNKLKTQLKLTLSQADAIRPIIKDYLVQHRTVLNDAAGQGIINHFDLKSALRALKETEYQNLRKIFSADQMNKMIEKDNLMATLNPDSVDSSVDDAASLTPNGTNLKF